MRPTTSATATSTWSAANPYGEAVQLGDRRFLQGRARYLVGGAVGVRQAAEHFVHETHFTLEVPQLRDLAALQVRQVDARTGVEQRQIDRQIDHLFDRAAAPGNSWAGTKRVHWAVSRSYSVPTWRSRKRSRAPWPPRRSTGQTGADVVDPAQHLGRELGDDRHRAQVVLQLGDAGCAGDDGADTRVAHGPSDG